MDMLELQFLALSVGCILSFLLSTSPIWRANCNNVWCIILSYVPCFYGYFGVELLALAVGCIQSFLLSTLFIWGANCNVWFCCGSCGIIVLQQHHCVLLVGLPGFYSIGYLGFKLSSSGCWLQSQPSFSFIHWGSYLQCGFVMFAMASLFSSSIAM